MPKFDNLARFKIEASKTVEYEMFEIETNGKMPVLMVASATRSNQAFLEESLRQNNARMRKAGQRRGRAMNALDPHEIDDMTEQDRQVLSKTVVKDWKNVFDDDGKFVPFNVDNCYEFLCAIPVEAFDDLKGFCLNPDNFVDHNAFGDVEETAKNLPNS